MKAVYTLILLAAVGAGAWAVRESIVRSDLQAQVDVLTKERDALRRTASLNVSLASSVESDPDGPRGFHADGTPVPDEEDGSAPKVARTERGIDPKLLAAAKEKMRRQMSGHYEPLLAQLSLGDSQRASLLSLLSERAELPFDITDNGDAEERRATLIRRRQDVERRLRDLLGADNWQKLAASDAASQERNYARTFLAAAAKRHLSLPPDLEPKLLAAVQQARSVIPLANDFSDPALADLSRLNEATLRDFIRQQNQLESAISDRIIEVLRGTTLPLKEALGALEDTENERRESAESVEILLRSLYRAERATD